MIRTEYLTKQFDRFVAVDEINLSVPTGQILVLLGPNGAGKTTTVRMLTSILRPTAGRAWVAGFDVVQQAQQVRASVGVLTEQHGLYNRMSSPDYLAFFADLYHLDHKAGIKRADELLEAFGLESARKKRLGEYSKGMRQKLALARAMLHDPPVLLLDEPTSAMDPESAHMVRETIRKMRSGERTIVLCTHNLIEAEELADQVAIIRQGRIIANGVVEDLKMEFLGPKEYEVELAQTASFEQFALPDGVKLLGAIENRARFRVPDIRKGNPELVRMFVEHGLDVISFKEAPRSLEEAYLEAMNRCVKEENDPTQ